MNLWTEVWLLFSLMAWTWSLQSLWCVPNHLMCLCVWVFVSARSVCCVFCLNEMEWHWKGKLSPHKPGQQKLLHLKSVWHCRHPYSVRLNFHCLCEAAKKMLLASDWCNHISLSHWSGKIKKISLYLSYRYSTVHPFPPNFQLIRKSTCLPLLISKALADQLMQLVLWEHCISLEDSGYICSTVFALQYVIPNVSLIIGLCVVTLTPSPQYAVLFRSPEDV